MITKGIVVDYVRDNKINVRLPIFENQGTTSNTVVSCTISYTSGVTNLYQIGDVVWVGFEDNQFGKPVVLGKLYIDDNSTAETAISSSALKITSSAILPENTKIGGFTRKDFLNVLTDIEKLKNTSGGTGGGNVDDVRVNGSSVVSNKIANVTVPTKTSDLTNDSGFITNATAQITESQVTNLTSDLTNITNVIPSSATSSNKLITKSDISNVYKYKDSVLFYDDLPYVENPYLSFISNTTFTLSIANSTKNWDGTIEYNIDGTWNIWDGTNTITTTNNYIKLRGTNNTIITGSSGFPKRFVLNGTNISANGNIENLLDYQQVSLGNHPQLGNACFKEMFASNSGLIKAPKLSSPILSSSCYQGMFQSCVNLKTIPLLPALNLMPICYFYMFNACSKIKVSLTQDSEYQYTYRIPTTGTGVDSSSSLTGIFINTGGTYKGDATINTIYYTNENPNESTPDIGDVYNIVNADAERGIKAGDNVAWNGNAWNKLGGDVDLSNYYTKSQTDSLVNNSKGVYNCTFGTTTYDEMKNARDSGKMCICHYGGITYFGSYWNDSGNWVYFFGGIVGKSARLLWCSNSSWSVASDPLQEKALVTTISSSSDNTHYPSAKSVYDFVIAYLGTITGYDNTKTQILKNVNGTLTWVDE